MRKNLTCLENSLILFSKFLRGNELVHKVIMLQIVAYVRYSDASIMLDWHIFLGALIFFILCGILIFQNQIWEEEDYSRNKKWHKWKSSAINANKGDLSGIYPTSKKQ